MNLVVLVGTLVRPPKSAILPSGTHMVSYELTVTYPGARDELVPVVWLEAPASASTHPTNEQLLVMGRVRRRFFRSKGATQSRTEVVATSVEVATHAALEQARAEFALQIGAA